MCINVLACMRVCAYVCEFVCDCVFYVSVRPFACVWEYVCK
jgi:hypothetical protein